MSGPTTEMVAVPAAVLALTGTAFVPASAAVKLSTPAWPAGPAGPAGPVAPADPADPAAPAAPAGPTGPASPSQAARKPKVSL